MVVVILICKWHSKRIHIFVSILLLSSFSDVLAQYGEFKLNVIISYTGLGHID